MQKFSLTTTSKLHYNTIFTVLILPTIIIASEVLPKESNKIAIVACFIVFITIIALIAYKYSRQKVELTIKENFLQIDWIKLPIYQKKEDKKISWNEIESYKYEKGKEFNTFKFGLANGQKNSFAISNSSDLDTFNEFYRVFIEKVDKHKISMDSA